MPCRFCWVVAFWGLLFEGLFADARAEWDLAGLMGTITVGQAQWQRLDVQPGMRLGELEVVFDLELFLDPEGRVRNSGWDFSTRRKGIESALRKIHYLRYGRANDRSRRLYLQAGAVEGVTLGSGLLMRNYRNTHGAPGIKRLGLDVQIRNFWGDKMTVRTLIGDVGEVLDLDDAGPLVGGRVEFYPLPLLDVGVTAVVDADQLRGLPDSIRANHPRDAFAAASVDVAYPFVNKQHLRAEVYAGIGRILDGETGTGISLPGMMFEAGPLRLRAEYQWTQGRFQHGHFDALYDVNRAIVDPNTGSITTRESTLRDASMRGVFGEAFLNIYRTLLASGSYQYLTGEVSNAQIVEGRVGFAPEFLTRLHKVARAEGYFEKRVRGSDLGKLFDTTSDTRFGYLVILEPVANVGMVWDVEFTYRPDGAGGFERQRTLNIQIKMDL